MFKNREIRIKLDKTKKVKDETAQPEEVVSPETAALIEETGRNLVTMLATTAVCTFAIIKVVDTICEIALKKTKSADNEE